MAATLERLVQVRSRPVEALRDYLRAMERNLAANRLLERFKLRLDELRLPLRVVPHEPVRDIEEVRAREHFRQTISTDDGEDSAKGPRRAYAFRGAGLNDDRESRARPEPLDALEPKLDLAVVLGDPGNGKTEWLKLQARRRAREAREQLEAFAVSVADLLFPAYVRLPDVAHELADEGALRKLLHATHCVSSYPAALTEPERMSAAILAVLYTKKYMPAHLAPWVWRRLTAEKARGEGGALVLYLDAWDEVRGDRKVLAACLNAFARTTHARFFLTSRIIGYTDSPLPVEPRAEGPRRELRLCPFDWADTEKFVTSFFAQDPPRGQQMLHELRTKVAVAGMAQNPLLATLLCMAFSPSPDRPPLGFPARRVEVYERVLAGLLGEWEAKDKGAAPPKGVIEAKVRLLEEMAYRFFPDEELTGKQLHDFLWDETAGYMTKLDDVDPLKQWLRQAAHGDLLQNLCHDGVLVPCGGAESYLFLHLTFQEYLCAGAIGRRAQTEGWDAIAPLVNKKAWDPTSHEVIILLAGKLSDAKSALRDRKPSGRQSQLPVGDAPGPERLLDVLTKGWNKTGKDDYFRHRLALAALCLPEIDKGRRAQCTKLIDHITTAAFSTWWEHQVKNTAAAVPHLTRALTALGQVNGRMKGTPLLEWLWHRLNEKETYARRSVVRAVQGVGAPAATADILARLAELLRAPDGVVRRAAAYALWGLGAPAATAEIRARLAELLRDPDHSVRQGAVAEVRRLGAPAATADILARLVDLLRPRHEYVQWTAAKAVWDPGAATADILARLAELLRAPDGVVRGAAADALWGLGAPAATPDIRARLAELLRDPDHSVRQGALAVVARLGAPAATPDILARLAELLRDPDVRVRRVAAAAVGGVGAPATTPAILAQLAELLRDPHEGLREDAAAAGGGVGRPGGADVQDARREVGGANRPAVESVGVWGKLLRSGTQHCCCRSREA